jgi:hypothetical protein
MTKKLKTKAQVRSDAELMSDATTKLKEATSAFYGEYYNWDYNYSNIGMQYYEKLKDACEKLDFATKRADKKYVGSDKIDWKTTTHECQYEEMSSNVD